MAQIRLLFGKENLKERDPRDKLSAASFCGDHLFTAGDDGQFIERFSPGKRGWLARHRAFRLRDFLPVPGRPEEELDLEGLAAAGGYLWVLGAHSLQRQKPAKDFPKQEEVFRGLGKASLSPGHLLLGRIPLVRDAGGAPAPVRRDKERRAAIFPIRRGTNELRRALARDPHLGAFVNIPGKENGLDFEGLAVRGEKIFLGCRGPVLRGWACVLELRVEDCGEGLRLRRVNGAHYRKHFLYCDGLGIRELEFRGDDLLVLAGPTMLLDGPMHIYRWKNASRRRGDSATRRGSLDHLYEVPRLRGRDAGKDRAEGLAVMPGGKKLMVIYDNASAKRRPGKGTYVADTLPLRVKSGREPDSTP